MVPVVWDAHTTELPDRMLDQPTINLTNSSIAAAHPQLEAVTDRYETEKELGRVVIGLVIAGLLVSKQWVPKGHHSSPGLLRCTYGY